MKFFTDHKILVIAGAVLIAAAVWFGLSGGGSPSSASLVTTQGANAGMSAADQNLVSTLLALRAVKLDGAVFSEPSFQSLQDFSTQIVSEPVGRANPFAPLQAQGSLSASSTHAAAIFAPATK